LLGLRGRACLRLCDGCQLRSGLLDLCSRLFNLRRGHYLPHFLSTGADRGLHAGNIG
jgi:hypothetical protein